MSAGPHPTTPGTSEDGSVAESTPRGRPRGTAPTKPATLVQLSASADAVVSKSGVLLVRGQRAFRLNDREAERLARAVAQEYRLV